MVKIHWSVYFILGAGIIGLSYWIDEAKLQLFIWCGYAFLAVGVGKLLFWFISRPKMTKREARLFQQNQARNQGNYQYYNHYNQHHHNQFQNNQHPNNQNNHQLNRKNFCHGCGSQLRGFENFCPSCGRRLNY